MFAFGELLLPCLDFFLPGKGHSILDPVNHSRHVPNGHIDILPRARKASNSSLCVVSVFLLLGCNSEPRHLLRRFVPADLLSRSLDVEREWVVERFEVKKAMIPLP